MSGFLFHCFCGQVLSLLVCTASCATWNTVKDEHVKLYDAYSVSSLHSYTDTIPNNDYSVPLEVSLEMEMTSLGDYDAVNGAIDIIGSINMTWTDHLRTLHSVAFDSTAVSEILLDYRKIWTPVIVLLNSADSVQRVGDEAYKVRFNLGTGQVSWKPRMIIRASCTPDVSYFPFDQQKCEFQFAPWFMTSDKLKLTVSSNTWNMENYDKNGVWEIESTESTAFLSGDFYYATFTVTFNRAPTYFVMTLVLPILFLSLLSGLVFLLPAASGERVGFVITCFLTFVVLLQTTMTYLPQASAPMSLLCYYVIVMMVFSAFLSLANALLLRIYHKPKGDEVPRWLTHVMEIIKCIKCRRIVCRKKYNSVEDSNENLTHRPSFRNSRVTPVRAIFNSKRIEPSLRQITSLIDMKQNESKIGLPSKVGTIQPETSFTIKKEDSKQVFNGTEIDESVSENKIETNGIKRVGSNLINKSGIKREDSKPVLNGIKVSSNENENQVGDKKDESSLIDKLVIQKEDSKPVLNDIKVEAALSENENQMDGIITVGSSLTEKKEDSKPVLNDIKVEALLTENKNQTNNIITVGSSLTDKKDDSKPILNDTEVEASSSVNKNQTNGIITVGSSLKDKSDIKKEDSKPFLNGFRVEASSSVNENQTNGIKTVGLSLPDKPGRKEAFSEKSETTSSKRNDEDENEIDWDSVGKVLDTFFLFVFIGVQCAFSLFFLVPLGSRA